MILEKQFIFDLTDGFRVVNFGDVKNYIKAKINHFQIYENWKSKREHLKLFQEIINMVNEDIQNPTVDLSGISNLLFYEKIDINNAIRYYDLVYILGAISFGVFDYGKNALNHTEGGEYGAINLGTLTQYAYNELYMAKKKSTPIYGATLSTVTIIESELKRKFKYLVMRELIGVTEKKIQGGLYIPCLEERQILDCLED